MLQLSSIGLQIGRIGIKSRLRSGYPSSLLWPSIKANWRLEARQLYLLSAVSLFHYTSRLFSPEFSDRLRQCRRLIVGRFSSHLHRFQKWMLIDATSEEPEDASSYRPPHPSRPQRPAQPPIGSKPIFLSTSPSIPVPFLRTAAFLLRAKNCLCPNYLPIGR